MSDEYTNSIKISTHNMIHYYIHTINDNNIKYLLHDKNNLFNNICWHCSEIVKNNDIVQIPHSESENIGYFCSLECAMSKLNSSDISDKNEILLKLKTKYSANK